MNTKNSNKSKRLIFAGMIFAVSFFIIVYLHISESIIDRQIGQWLFSHMTQSTMTIFEIISDLGDSRLIVPISLFLILYLLLKRKWSVAAGLFFCVFGGGAISSLLKYFFQKTKMEIFQMNVFDGDFGFPSGHTIMSILFYGYLAYLLVKKYQNQKWNWIFWVFAGLVSFLVGISRILINVHLPSDVLAGWEIGFIWLIVSIVFNKKIETIHKHKA